jgi:ribosome-associated toxin RatA of RatAB toxin-antitoxin module
MPIIEHDIEIRATATTIYAVAQDYGIRKQWDPFARGHAFLGGESRPRPGVKLEVHAHNGLTMCVEFITVNPPTRAAIRMLRGPFFFRQFAGSWIFLPKDEATALVRFRYSFSTAWRWLSPILDPLIVRVFGRDTKRRLQALKAYCESLAINSPAMLNG